MLNIGYFLILTPSSIDYMFSIYRLSSIANINMVFTLHLPVDASFYFLGLDFSKEWVNGVSFEITTQRTGLKLTLDEVKCRYNECDMKFVYFAGQIYDVSTPMNLDDPHLSSIGTTVCQSDLDGVGY